MKFSGKAGFRTINAEVAPGVYKDHIEEISVKGDVLSYGYGHSPQTDTTNDDLTINNQLSIVADKFFKENISNLVYVSFNHVKWKVSSFQYRGKRAILNLGGVYNGS